MKLITNFSLFIFTFLTCISLINTKSVTGSSLIPAQYCNVHGNQGWTSYLLLQYEFVPPNPNELDKNTSNFLSNVLLNKFNLLAA